MITVLLFIIVIILIGGVLGKMIDVSEADKKRNEELRKKAENGTLTGAEKITYILITIQLLLKAILAFGLAGIIFYFLFKTF